MEKALWQEVVASLATQVDTLYPPPKLGSAPLHVKRTPLGKQREAINALYTAFKEGRRGRKLLPKVLFLSGKEGDGIGVGKTYISIATATALLHPEGRVLVICPPHLTRKWEDEVRRDGLKAVVVETPEDFLKAVRRRPEGVEFLIVSKDRAKRQPKREPAFLVRQRGATKVAYCPDCGAHLGRPEGVGKTCRACGSPLWQETGGVTLGKLIDRYIEAFGFLVLDEAHQYKNASQQGLFAARLMQRLPTLLVSGTIMGGFASDLYYLMRSARPDVVGGVTQKEFVETYGVTVRVTREIRYPDGETKRQRSEREAPGFAPTLVPLLLEKGYFIGLKEVGVLPPYTEKAHIVPTSPEQQAFLGDLLAIAEDLRGGTQGGRQEEKATYLGTLAISAYLGLDVPGVQYVVAGGQVWPLSHPIPHQGLLPKEQVLLGLVRLSRAKGEKAVIFVEGTNTWDVQARLWEILRDDGHHPFILTSEVPPERRYALLKRAPEVLITNPRLVETGLDLVEYSTGIFYQIPLSTFTFRQAARRIYRLGQEKRVSLYYLAYEGLQESLLTWVGEKVRQSTLFEGSYTNPHLSFGEEDPMEVLGKALYGEVARYRGEGIFADPTFTPSVPELPTLPEDRTIRVGRRKVVMKAGQPVLFV